MANTIVELKELEIDKVVERMKLSVLANHIVNSLHEMTTTASHGSTCKYPENDIRSISSNDVSDFHCSLCSTWTACLNVRSSFNLCTRAFGADDF